MSETKMAEGAAKLASKWTEQAEQAIKSTDVAALRSVLDDAVKHNGQMATAMDALIGLYMGKGNLPKAPITESESAIAAMRDVALAAVELSKAVIQNRSEVSP